MLPFLLEPRGPLPLSYPVFAAYGLVIAFVTSVQLFFARHTLLRNTANRRLVHMLQAGWLGAMVVLAGCWAYGYRIGNMFYMVGLVMTAVGMQLAVVVERRIWFLLPPGIAIGFANVWFPSLDPLFTLGLSVIGIMAFMSFVWWRDAQPAG